MYVKRCKDMDLQWEVWDSVYAGAENSLRLIDEWKQNVCYNMMFKISSYLCKL